MLWPEERFRAVLHGISGGLGIPIIAFRNRQIEGFIGDAGAGLCVGLSVSFVLSSIGTAGINTLVVARCLLGFAWLSASAFVLAGTPTANLKLRSKLVIVILVGFALFGIERWETYSQPKPRRFPVPPLRLMLPARALTPVGQHLWLAAPVGFPVQFNSMDAPMGGFAGFGDNEGDDAMLAVPWVTFANKSDKPVTLSWSLRVFGEGRHLELAGDGRGRWERRLNVNDWMSSRDQELNWLLSPITLMPGEIRSGPLAFVAPSVDSKTREDIARQRFGNVYRYELVLRAVGAKNAVGITLPLKIEPPPAAASGAAR